MGNKPGEKVRFGLAGCGRAGVNHLQTLCSIPGAEVVAVCDKRRDAAEATAKEFNIGGVYTDADEMFGKEHLDAVANITSTGGHYPITMAAARHKIHVFLEKPMSTSYSQAEAMVAACKKAGVLLAVTYTYRFIDETREIKKIMDSGTLGKILEIRFLRYGSSPHKHPEGSEMRRQRDNLNTEEGLGIIYDCGIHSIDLLRWYAGTEPVRMEAWGTHHQGYPYPDAATCMMEFSDGVKGIFDYGPLVGTHEQLGTGIVLIYILVGGDRGSVIYTFGANIAGRTDSTSYLEVLTKDTHEVKTFPVYQKKRDLQYIQFIESVSAGKLTGYFPSPEEAALTTKTAERMLQLAMSNRVNSPTGKKRA